MALPISLVCECRQTGNDANGGGFDPSVTSPGTDYTLQDAAQVSYSDLVIGGTATQLTSAASPFTSAHVGNTIQVTSGTGFTASWYNVRSVSGSVATVDRAVGTAGSTGGVGKLGGALATPGMIARLISAGTGGTIAFLKYSATAYTSTATTNVAGGAMAPSNPCSIWGYDTSRTVGNADGNRPTIQASANSMTLASGSSSNNVNYGQLILDANGHTSVDGVASGARVHATRVKATGCRFGFSLNGNGWVEGCEAVACTSGGYNLAGSGALAGRCSATGCTVFGFQLGAGGAAVADCHAIGTLLGPGFSLAGTGTVARHCTARGSTGTQGDGFIVSQSEGLLVGCRAWGNANYGFKLATADNSSRMIRCAAGPNGVGAYNATWATAQLEGFVTLTADPDTNAAGGDYSPNGAAGGGLAVKGIADLLPGTNTTSYRDLGAAQSAASGGSTTVVGVSRSRTIMG